MNLAKRILFFLLILAGGIGFFFAGFALVVLSVFYPEVAGGILIALWAALAWQISRPASDSSTDH